ncbi:hypothetical protein C9J01_18765 [Photobacterium rosenbergii]|uniref:Uncharacterized protein n=1 Tax=Photobacterium rosenbergii TaxID=294936 RepID=A0A2T3N9P8_9GAMM|nr:hypothetical protein [Photobacterium rosenbergii]PSW10256.1 hypothetical protein C9J01_18765 [Photobacterium rosenbergii]
MKKYNKITGMDLARRQFKAEKVESYQEIEITPQLAAIMLSFNRENITEAKGKITEYAQAMEEGRWLYNGDSFRFSRPKTIDGGSAYASMLDGQNRCKAIIKSGKTIKANIILGLEPNTFDTIDVGRKRTQTQLVGRTFRDRIDNSGTASTITNAVQRVLIHDANLSQKSGLKPHNTSKVNITQSDVEAYMDANLDQLLRHHEQLREIVGYQNNVMPASQMMFMFHIGARHHEEYTKAYFRQAFAGLNLTGQETLYFLNQFLHRARSEKIVMADRVQVCFKVWNAVALDGAKAIGKAAGLKVRSGENTNQLTAPSAKAIKDFLGQ